MFPASGSRKLTGLYICLGALLVLAIIATVAVAFFHVGESLFSQLGGMITTMGGAHQTAQAMADRSPNYPNVTPGPPVSVMQPAAVAEPSRDPGNLLSRLWRPQVAAYGAVVALGVMLMGWPAL